VFCWGRIVTDKVSDCGSSNKLISKKYKNCRHCTDPHNILNRWKNYFSQLLNVHNVSNVRQIEVYMAEPLVPGPSCLEVEIAIAKLKSINRHVVFKFLQNSFRQKAKSYSLRSTNSLILFGIMNNCLISGRSLLLYQFTKRVTKLTVIIIVGYHCHHTKFYRTIEWGEDWRL
jgi:hypothetical protein